MAEPLIHLCQRTGTQAVHPELRLVTYVDETGFAEDSQVARHPGASNRQLSGQLVHRRGTLPENLEHGPSTLIRQGVEHCVHDGTM